MISSLLGAWPLGEARAGAAVAGIPFASHLPMPFSTVSRSIGSVRHSWLFTKRMNGRTLSVP